MTALAAAIVELEAHREHVARMIAALRRMSRVIEEAHEPLQAARQATTAATMTVPTPSVTASPVAPAKAAPAAGKANGLTPDDRILRELGVCDVPISWRHLIKATKLPAAKLRATLRALVASGLVRKTGSTCDARYALHRSGPETPAGTRAALPVVASPVSGHTASSTRDPEVVWNGALERAGQAPSLLPPREQKR